ncbi:MAG TPA: SPOR domain-containing protein [Tepidisphaeraceae bacterium]|jgi:tetratricopeptide (TPR) repeat protein|nr:SPOR domain-containing protein [Tepidisphaeraceae bacterium]
MRNTLHASGLLVALFTMVGCVDQASRQTLQSGYAALDARQYDQAISSADQFLTKSPQGQGSADALYLKGRALEERATASSDPAKAKADLQSARTTYISALQQKPPRTLDGRIRAGIANVAYWQDDYQTAAQQWSAAYNNIDDPAAKSFILYRVGLAQQRMGDFAAADQTFASVEQQFPNTEGATRAKERQGARAYTVQLATYANAATADANIAQLRKEGLNPTRTADTQGRVIVSITPVANYQQAMQLKNRLAARYPNALVVP